MTRQRNSNYRNLGAASEQRARRLTKEQKLLLVINATGMKLRQRRPGQSAQYYLRVAIRYHRIFG